MKSLKIISHQLSITLSEITKEAVVLAENLNSNNISDNESDDIEDILSQSLVINSIIVDTLINGNPQELSKINNLSKDFLRNLKDINSMIKLKNE